MDEQKLLTVGIDEAARMLSVSPRTVFILVKTNRIPHRKIGRRTIITIPDLEKYVRELPSDAH
jgi:excisionase family DNA binding protein